MPASIDLTQHALLSTRAAALTPDELDAYTMMAQDQLGLRGTFTGEDLADAQVYAARQVNRILEWERYQGVQSISKAGQSLTFRTGKSAPVDPIAQRGADRLMGRATRPRSGPLQNVQTW